jgi:dihydroorotase
MADIAIELGVIKNIGKNLKADKDATVWEFDELHVSAGWFDITVHFCDPGEEQKEDIASGLKAAAAGGFTGVGLLPVTNPPINGKGQIEYVLNRAKYSTIEIVPYGCLSANLDRINLSEMADMCAAGARAFTDYINPVDAGLLLRAMLYSTDLNATIFSFPTENSLTHNGMMHEGNVNIQLGLKGMPTIAEEIAVARDLFLAKHNQSKLHLLNISTANSVEMIRKAKKEKTNITSQVTIHNLFFSDVDLTDFDTNLKLIPPLRSQIHIDALIEGLKDGTIDCVTSDHYPQDIESKKVEFDQALYGSIGLEAMFGALNKITSGKLKLDQLISILTTNPRKILGLDQPTITEGAKANITLFNPNIEYEFTKNNIVSKGVNCPYVGQKLKGKVLGVIS